MHPLWILRHTNIYLITFNIMPDLWNMRVKDKYYTVVQSRILLCSSKTVKWLNNSYDMIDDWWRGNGWRVGEKNVHASHITIVGCVHERFVRCVKSVFLKRLHRCVWSWGVTGIHTRMEIAASRFNKRQHYYDLYYIIITTFINVVPSTRRVTIHK